MKSISNILTRIEPVLVRIDERTKEMPTGKELGELKGRVAQIPSFLQTIGIVAALVALTLGGLIGATISLHPRPHHQHIEQDKGEEGI